MRNAGTRTLLLIIFLLCLSACDSPTPNSSQNITDSSNNTSPTGNTIVVPQSVTQLWEAQPGHFMRSTPTVVDGVVYATFEDYCICAFSAATGEKLWGIDPPGVSLSTPVAWNDMVFLTLAGDLRIEPDVTQTAYIYALDAKTGDGRWRYKVPDAPDEYAANPVLADGIVYFASGYSEYAAYNQGSAGHLTALDAATGEVIWQKSMKGSQSGGFALSDGTIFLSEGLDIGSLQNAGFDRDKDILYALDSKTGAEKWRLNIDYQVPGNLVVQSGHLYITRGDTLTVLDTASGKQLWEVTRSGKSLSLPSLPALTSDKVYLAENDEREFCFEGCSGPPKTYLDHFLVRDAASGKELLRTEIGSDDPHNFVLHDGLLYYTTFRPNNLVSLDPATGKFHHIYEAEDSFGGDAAFDGGPP